MTSRLDRLFLLLDSGSTPLTRKAAALQLGEVQKLHPHELNNLLIKVRNYLHSSSWDTRIAASQAVEAIITNVPLWFPNGIIVKKEEDALEKDQQTDECRMIFDRYDINMVIKCGHNLLASELKNYDETESFKSTDSPLDRNEKIAQMKKSLNQKLGLTYLENDFISNSDLEVRNEINYTNSNGNNDNILIDDFITKATGRTLKRTLSKTKIIDPGSGLNSTENSNDSTMLNNKKIKVEPKEEPNESIILNENENTQDGNEWPLAWFSDELMNDLLNPQWEVRHGSAIGLREIVKLQGRCGGRLNTASAKQQDNLNQLWLEDLSVRLLTVLALDKFGDYVSDQVVAPVRESCAQVLGLIIKFLSVDGVVSVLKILLQLLQCSKWEARHGGMLGVKYMLAVRRDMIEKLLPEVFEPVFNGLKDPEDDVSAVAAAALVPVKDDLMRLMPEKVPLVISFLWEALLVLDDLSSSTGDLLMLLSSLLTFKGLENEQHSLLAYDNDQLVKLIPRLWPFLFHSLSSVRKSVLESLLILSEKSSNSWLSSSILSDALRLLFQRSLIENHNSILELLYKVWLRLISKASYECLIDSTKNYMTGWIILMMHSHKLPIDPNTIPVWLELNHISTAQNSIKNRHSQQDISLSGHYFIGGFDCLGDSVEERERCTTRARYQCARLIGALAFSLTEDINKQETYESFACILLSHLESKSALQRMCSAWIIREWKMAQINKYGEPTPFWIGQNDNENSESNGKLEIIETNNDEGLNNSALQLHKSLSDRCNGMLDEQIWFDELSNYVSRVQNNFRDLLSFLRNNKLSFNEDDLAGRTIYTFNQINAVVNDVNSKLLNELRIKLSDSKKPSAKLKSMIEKIEERINFIRKSISELNHFSNALSIGVKSSLASALVEWQFLPDRFSPIIRPLMDSIKSEENEQLQRGSASSLVKLLNIFCERTHRNATLLTPTQKIISNLITYLCSDKNFTPEVTLIVSLNDHDYQSNSNIQYGILALDNMQKNAERSILLRRSNSLNLKNKGNNDIENTTSTSLINNSNIISINIDPEKIGEIQRRGATITLSEMCRYFANSLPNQLPSLWEYITNISLDKQTPPTINENSLDKCKHLIHSLQVFEIIGPYLHQKLHSYLLCSYDFLCQCLQSPFITIRHMASRCFGMLSSIMSNSTMNIILTKVLDMLEAADCELKRQGAVEAIYFVIDRLSLKIVPYIVLLIVPMLGRMSDQNESVRLLSTHCFAQLVQLMPLDNENNNNQHNQNHYLSIKKKNENTKESSLNGPITSYKDAINSSQIEFSEELLARKKNERHFLEQLMNIKKLDDYKMPIPVKAELRQYQQDGVNWLFFLNKYKLHGIVADEMGLGKTLQAICILASDHYYMKQNYFNEKSANPPLLSLVICPPTLIGHWMYEVEKFVDSYHLNPIMYTGPPLERAKIKLKIQVALEMLTQDIKSNYNLIIASYDLVRNDIDFFNRINWNYCILDEGHVIKNGKTKLAKTIKTLKANHRLILTGTPIQNNVLELWSLFDFLMPGFLGTERQFTARYSKPIFASRDAKSSSKEQEIGILAMENLHRQVLPFILRRMKEDVLKDLPPKIIQDYYCELSPLQAQLYEDFYKSRTRQTLKNNLDTEVKEITATSNSYHKKYDVSKSHIFQSLQYLRKVCNHPKLVLSASHPNYDAIMNKLKMENTALSNICHAAKLVALKQLLQDCGIGIQTENEQTEPVVNQHRALIFCQLKSMLDIVEKDLLNTHMKSVSYLRLDGDVPSASRYSVIHRFNNDPSIDVLLLTIQVGGLGLNLTGADTVIFVEHDWNPMKDLQAMDRAHRIGQKKVVNVYRLLTKGTLEEKIMGLQKFKLTIANTVISSENSCLDSMATDQLLDLFELTPAAKGKHENNNNGKTSSTLLDGTGQVSMKTMLDSLPELWDTTQYDNEYDLNNFLQSLSNI